MSFKKLIREAMLPTALVLGTGSYLVFHFTPALYPIGPVCHEIAARGQTFLISVMLFLQYIRIAPKDLRFHRWHLWVLLFQVVLFAATTAIALLLPPGTARIVAESALLCLICPTASAAGIITERLGGSLPATMGYVVLIYCVTTLLIPAVVPILHPSEDFSFWMGVWRLLRKLFPMLILPGILAWVIRYAWPGLHRALYKISHLSFYVWGVSLTLAMVLATRALVLSDPTPGLLLGIMAAACGSCILQYAAGRFIGRHVPDPGATTESRIVTAGQSLGQKNTGLLIWLGYSFMTPVTSIAGGLYAIFQNIWNSWEIYRRENR